MRTGTVIGSSWLGSTARFPLLAAALLATSCGGQDHTANVPKAVTTDNDTVGRCARMAPGVGPMPANVVREGATLALVKATGRDAPTIAYIADEDDRAIVTVDIDAGRELARSQLSGTPSQLLVLADGRIAVAIRDQNRIEVLEPINQTGSLVSRCTTSVATEPVALAVSPDDRQVAVSSGFGQTLTMLRATDFEATETVPLAREPRAIVFDDDGRRVFVAHVVGATMSVVDLEVLGKLGETTSLSDSSRRGALVGAKAIRAVDLRMQDESRGEGMRSGCQGYALAKAIVSAEPVGSAVPAATGSPLEQPPIEGKVTRSRPRRILAPMVTVDPGRPEVRPQGYGEVRGSIGVEHPTVTVVDPAAERTISTAIASAGLRTEKNCLLPRAAVTDDADNALFVTCLGADLVMELDARGPDPMRLLRRRWSVPGGPTGIAVDLTGNRLVVWSQFDHALSVLDRAKDDRQASSPANTIQIVRRDPTLSPEALWGRVVFHRTDDPRISSDGRACASCHPDGREDALTWSTPEGPRQTVMLAGRLTKSAPFGWFGNHRDLQNHIDVTFERLRGRGFDAKGEREQDALIAYLREMPAPTMAETAVDKNQAARIAEGRTLFMDEAQGCAGCHLETIGTDGLIHDVGSMHPVDRHPEVASDPEASRRFDTPSLQFVSGTAPYFHDGRYATLEAMLSEGDEMGHTRHLSHQQIAALTSFLETL